MTKNSVFITGAAKGIGAAIARAFAARGYRVAIGYRTSRAEAKQLAESLVGAPRVMTVSIDVTDLQSIDRACTEVTDAFGTVGVLVNNAGAAYRGLFQTMSDVQIDDLIRTDLTGAMLVTKRFLPDMIRASYGRIVQISSMWGISGASCEVVYSAAKAGLIGFTKALAREVGPSGITVNAVAPGVIETDMLKEFSAETRGELAASCAVCRLGTPEDVARAVIFLTDDNQGFVTGQVLTVDGGFL